MNLPEALRKQREDFIHAAPKETVAVMQQAQENLHQSGILRNCLTKGDTAPDFTLEDHTGTLINLHKTLNNGPVILKFFRGDW